MNKPTQIQQIAKGVVCVLGLNPGPFTLEGTNTYLFGEGKQRLLVDTGDGKQPKYFDLLRQCLGSDSRISQILLTHWHADHIGGIDNLLAMNDIVTAECSVFKHQTPIDGDDVSSQLSLAISQNQLHDIADRQVFTCENWNLQAVYTPGHTDDHMSFLVTGESKDEQRLLLTGDLVLGRGTTIVDKLTLYMDSLKRIQGIQPTMLLPGHGPVISGRTDGVYNAMRVIDGYIEHRNMRERQIIAVLKTPPPNKPPLPRNGDWKIEEITSVVYPDISDPQIIRAAQNNVRLHLEKLEAEGIVEHRDLWRLKEKSADLIRD
ncbi:Beta-lactamase-like protein 2 [Coemansia sp. RSA 989]|nr:beta-lactamase-like protein [Coemansia mojavensis]KAJ1752479.1 Beta-lactamase-like protein 2 [Coemansia sp. RSA 1821]KAJ1865296.1 Beta-lactamase-like protein 2 [Coemansia sp. RSA 989]